MEEKRLFGEIAIEKGFITLDQLRRALDIQREMIRSGEGHKLIGVLLVELGYLTPEQVVEILETYDRERAADVAPSGETRSFTSEVGALSDDSDPLLPKG